MQQIIPITTLLLGALLVLLTARLTQRRGSGATALSLSLCGVALGLALIPVNWQAWLAGGEMGDRVLTFARELGLTGLFFFAGTRFDLKEVWQARRVSLFVGVSGLLLFSLTAGALLLLGQSDSTAVTAAAAIVGTSVWLPSQFSLASERGAVAAAPFKGAGAALTLLSLVALHFYAVFYALSDRAMNRSAWIVVALYEATKLAVFFSSAYFAASSFLSRSDGPSARTLIGYALIVVLVFVLALSVVGQVGALAWALASGALLGSSKTGRKMRESQQSAAVVVFLSFAFLPMLLQAHGRQLTDVPLIFFAVIAALTYKFAVVWGGARVAGASSADAGRIAAVTLASGEIGILVLGFSYTRWLVESELFYGILSYAFISLLISPVLWRLFASFDDQLTVSQLTDTGHEQKASRRRQTVVSVAMVVACLLTLASGARAQAASTTKEEDPVARARAMIGNMVDERAAAAERVLTAAKLVNESVAARQEGRLDQAKEALVKAERVMTEAATVQHNLLVEELLRRLAEEQAMLNPKPAALLLPPATDYLLVPKVPRLVVARYQTYRDAFTRILAEEQVPVELLAVAFVESGFNPQSLSPKGARGIWQFMPETAKRYGLPVRPADDHRTHPEHSTRAAARYLRDLYQQFRDWKLALAAYNAGETRVQRIIDQTGIRNFDEMARRGLLPLETRNYVPAVLAVWSQLSGRSADGKAGDHFGWKVPKRTETN